MAGFTFRLSTCAHPVAIVLEVLGDSSIKQIAPDHDRAASNAPARNSWAGWPAHSARKRTPSPSSSTRGTHRPQLAHQGIQVLFAVAQQEADDLIEERIQRESTPRQLTIVSDDHRLHDAARRQGCPALDALDFFAFVETGRRDRRPAKPAGTKPAEPAADKVSAQELQHWLEQFSELQGDGEWQEFLDFDPEEPEDPRAGRKFP
ncbi:MAG: NYN domain-containing protein [Gemmataceae bacterium]